MPLSFERNKSWNLKKDARRQQKKEGGRIVHGAAAQDGLLLLGVSETRKIANGANRQCERAQIPSEETEQAIWVPSETGVWDSDRKTHIEIIGSMGK